MRMAGAMPTEPNITQAVPFFGVRDMEASLRFYVDGLGAVMTLNWMPEGKIRWCWLELGGAAVMLQEYRPGFVPDGKFGLAMSICFLCKDAIAYYKELRSRGIEAKRPFVGNGMWVTGLTDPDGYRLFFESLTDAEEESVHDGD